MKKPDAVSGPTVYHEELFDGAPIGLGIYKDLRILRVNETGARMLGYDSTDELVGVPVYEIIHPDDLTAVKERIRQAMLDRIPSPPMEERFIKKDKGFIQVLVLSKPIVYDCGDAVEVAFVSLEDRKKLEADLALEASRQEQEKIRLDTLLQSLDEGILFQNPEGKITFANGEFCRIFGYQNPESVIGRTSKDVIAQSQHRAKFPDEFFTRVVSDIEGRATVRAHRLEMADGSIVERSGVPLYGSSGNYAGRISLFRDITLREQNEEAVTRFQHTELLGRLAGGIAHDFNNVLGVIIGSLQMILTKTDNKSAVRENAQRALSSAVRGSEVAKRLFQFVRYSPEGFRVFSAREIIEQTALIIRHAFESNITVHEEFVLHDAPIFGSPGDLQQVLMNLADNARDAMPHGGSLTFSLTTADKKQIEKKLGAPPTNEYVLLVVQDAGSGIEEDKLQNIFDPFFTTKELGKGTGLGLSIVQTIVSAHGGFIEVKSHPGLGTTFFVYLPMSKNEPEVAPIPGLEESEGSSGYINSGTVLVVEDEVGLQELLDQYLSDKGLNVMVAGDGEEADWLFQQHPEISVVISDLGLPRLAGDKLIARIKERRPDVKCLLATGYLAPAGEDAFSKLGVKTILKPYDLNSIYKFVIDALSEQAQRD